MIRIRSVSVIVRYNYLVLFVGKCDKSGIIYSTVQ